MNDISQAVAEFGRHVTDFKKAVDSMEDKVISFNSCIERMEVIVNNLAEALEQAKAP